MKRILIFILLTLFLAGCGVFNLSNSSLPDDLTFLKAIEQLDTPQKIIDYMKENFKYESRAIHAPDPYILWKNQKGDIFNEWVEIYKYTPTESELRKIALKQLQTIYNNH